MADPLPVLTLSYERNTLPPRQWWHLPVVAVVSMAIPPALGAATNAINGLVCLPYFQTIVGWMYGQMVVFDCVRQGVWEGSFFGAVLMVVMSISYPASTGMRWPLRPMLMTLLVLVVCSLAGWVMGGIGGVCWGTFYPQSFRSVFITSPGVTSLTGWGWVGGSICGVECVGVIGVVVLPIAIHIRYRRLRRAARSS